ncbi:MAG: 4-(cytidine 5'-diphospho)-2-C-methyl-D-erythritol kinase [Sphingorhabdus sp.]
MPLTEIAHAKINLALHVRKRRDDGYHELETLYAFADAGDVLTAEHAETLTLEIVGPFAAGLSAGKDNLVMRAAKALQWGEQGARLVLQKNLPIASGIGGGSADAAAALRLLSRLWSADTDLLPIAASLGADVPACVHSQTMWGEGVGDVLKPFDDDQIAGTFVLLVNPGIACPTGPVFAAWDGIDRGALDLHNWTYARNDLQPPAVALFSEIAEILTALQQQEGVRVARMSGSGATCFALFDSAALRDKACAEIFQKHPHYWTLKAALR